MQIDAVNNAKNCLETVTLKYFEAGHTYMSADSFHRRVEKEVLRKGSLYDFQDFVESVDNVGKVFRM